VLALTGCCLATAAVTAFCGPLGFAGIASPHIARALSGQAAHRQILPLSLLVGGAIALAADLVAQHAPTPLPAGSTLALIGIPVILWILLRKPWME
jgi:iron complex transport system permease protein